MAPGQIVAYKRSWSESFEGRGTQSLKTAAQPLSLHSQIEERDDQERRFYDVGSRAYLRSKTVQPMGGSSVLTA
jgi:hypothetical protein